ncbi:carboxypeptidase-like regulatory domain-containing protein [Micromonospora sp. NPDC049523]|uniref:carboxypeptidase-like regulatory domain-containing protein n=1 Tax=Micromonospora sp. NPDC049523 TaxID=3155921 RepID=UPI0034232AFC
MRHVRSVLGLIVIVGLLSACGVSADGPDRSSNPGDPTPSKSDGPVVWGTVVGTVRGPAGQPVAGVLVVPGAVDPTLEVPEIAVTTDQDGRYVWQLLPGRYELTGRHDRRTSPAAAVTVVAGERSTVDLTLTG